MPPNPALAPGWPPLQTMTAEEAEQHQQLVAAAAGFREAQESNAALGARNDALELEIAQLRNLRPVAAELSDERRRQIDGEGWTLADDDSFTGGELARAAACYAISGTGDAEVSRNLLTAQWPWSRTWWKRKSPRRDLVRAGALIIAEIERLDRAQKRAEANPDV